MLGKCIVALLFVVTTGCSLFYPYSVVSYADSVGVDYSVAEYRLSMQHEIAELNSALLADKEHFGGLYIEHLPTYSINVLYKNKQNTPELDAFIAQKSWREFVKVHHVSFSLKEVSAAQKKAGVMVSKLNIRFSSGQDIKSNRADIGVLDKLELEQALLEKGLVLPKAVVIKVVSGFAEYE